MEKIIKITGENIQVFCDKCGSIIGGGTSGQPRTMPVNQPVMQKFIVRQGHWEPIMLWEPSLCWGTTEYYWVEDKPIEYFYPIY